MKKIIATLFIMLVFSPMVFSKEFKYDKVIACGPKKLNILDDAQRLESWSYYYIHTSLSGDFVVWNADYQYKSFEETNYSELWIQNGNKTFASREFRNGIWVYKLTNKYPTDTRVRVFMFDPNSMTFTSRIAGYQPSMGICWDIEINR